MFYGLILTHWIADFICQTDDMAKNKSKSNLWLGKHILSYMAVLWGFCITVAMIGVINGKGLPNDFRYLQFVAINGAAHFATDYVTSRINSKLWAKGEVHNFFVCVGFDQAVHMATLLWSFNLLIAR